MWHCYFYVMVGLGFYVFLVVLVNTELRTGVLATLQDQLSAHRADGENLQGLLAKWNQSAKGFAATTLATLAR
jgi:hypothetical protein